MIYFRYSITIIDTGTIYSQRILNYVKSNYHSSSKTEYLRYFVLHNIVYTYICGRISLQVHITSPFDENLCPWKPTPSIDG